MPFTDESNKKSRSSLLRDRRQEAAEDCNIHYHSDLVPDKWPTYHRQIFSKIKELGNYQFEAWRKDIYVDSSRPWREETKQRAENIVALAQRCREDKVAEGEWRHDLEPYIFLRFNLEVTCRNCTGKLWRSEIEAAAHSQDQFARRLPDRQNKREACTCPRQGPNAAPRVVDKLFASQYSSDIVHEDALRVKINKKSEQPDLAYGLRRIGRIKSLLWTKDKRPENGGEIIGRNIKTTPFRYNARTTFPFLMSESKSEKAGVPQSDIESQMAFVIRSSLLVQENLRRAAGKDSKWISGPLVWCVSHRGEDWQVSAAFLKYRGNIEHIHIVDLWNGKITTYDGAIRLVLIFDHIFDWARDVYREAIIAELQSLAVSAIRTHSIDADISSSVDMDTVNSCVEEPNDSIASVHRDRQLSFFDGEKHRVEKTGVNQLYQRNQEQGGERDCVVTEANLDPVVKLNRIASWNWGNVAQSSDFNTLDGVQDIRDPFRRFDSALGVLRDAKFIRSRVMGLYITEDNLNTLFNSRPTNKQSRHLLRRIIARLEAERPLFVSPEVLTALELAWTGVDRQSLEFLNLDDEFQVLLTFSAYLTPDWEQTRELCYIAISRRAKEVMYQFVWGRSRDPKGYLRSSYRRSSRVLDAEIVMKIICFHLQATIQTNLSACLYRCSQCPELTGRGSDDGGVEDDIFRDDQGEFSCQMIPHSTKKSRDLVWWIYKKHKVGRNEPSSPFLRVSCRWDEQKLDHGHDKSLPTPWTTYAISDSETAILAQSKTPKTVSAFFATRCIFLTNRSKLENLLADLRSRKQVFPYFFLTDRLGTEGGWKLSAWNKTYDRRKGDTSNPIQNFLKHIESVMQQEEEDDFADVGEEEESEEVEDLDDTSSEESEDDE